VKIFKEEMEKYREGISEEDLEFTKNSLIKSNARAMETLWSKMGLLTTMSTYGWDVSYKKDEEDIIRNMTSGAAQGAGAEVHPSGQDDLRRGRRRCYAVQRTEKGQLRRGVSAGQGGQYLRNSPKRSIRLCKISSPGPAMGRGLPMLLRKMEAFFGWNI
jgi:hypothetical protein